MKYDVFISYRRVGGKEYARMLTPELEKRGFKVFLDFNELDDGVFDQRIKDAISDSPVFLLILSKGALDRCINEGDWVREEILHAVKCGSHMVPVEFDKTFREIPKTTPKEIFDIISVHSWAQIDTEGLLQESVDKMVKKRIAPYVHREDTETGAEIHIDVDAACDLFRFKTFVRQLKAGDDNVIYLKPGRHRLEFVSTQISDVRKSMLYSLASDITCDVIEVVLKDEVEEVIAKRKAVEEHQKKLIALENTIFERIEEDGKYGFADESGNVVIPCKWMLAYSFFGGLACVKDDNGKWGYIDKTGTVVIPCKWKDAWSFSEGLACVMDDNEKWGFIDKTGKVVIPFKWKNAGSFSEGLAKVKGDNWRYGYIDKTGRVVIPCRWKDAYRFSEGLACVNDDNGKYGFIDKTGKEVIPCKWEVPGYFFGGLARVEDDNGKRWKIDKTGKVVKEGW